MSGDELGACRFGPAHEPWNCATHPGGFRTALTDDRCMVAKRLLVQWSVEIEGDDHNAWVLRNGGRYVEVWGAPGSGINADELAMRIARLLNDDEGLPR